MKLKFNPRRFSIIVLLTAIVASLFWLFSPRRGGAKTRGFLRAKEMQPARTRIVDASMFGPPPDEFLSGQTEQEEFENRSLPPLPRGRRVEYEPQMPTELPEPIKTYDEGE